MRVTVTVVPRARVRRVEAAGEGHLRVWVTAPPHEGRANAALIEILAEHYGVPRSCVRIVQGGSSRQKLVEVARRHRGP
jgi:uncharacterized protein (TIGR00251 family)